MHIERFYACSRRPSLGRAGKGGAALKAAVAANAEQHARNLAEVVSDIRAAGATSLREMAHPPVRMPLEQAIGYVNDDELVEVTPKIVRLRKRWLDTRERKRAGRRGEPLRMT